MLTTPDAHVSDAAVLPRTSHDEMDVALVAWPAEETKRVTLAQQGQPRLLIVAESAEAPTACGVFEDWIRLPASEEDVDARVRSLLVRAREHHEASPTVDGSCLLRYGHGSVALAPLHAQLAAPLVNNFESVVSRQELERAGWMGRAPTEDCLDRGIARLREVLGPMSLKIRRVGDRGFVMEPAYTVNTY